MAKSGKNDAAKVRLQVVICPKVAAVLEKHATELDRSQAWIAGWAISNTLRDRGGFGLWLTKRIKAASKNQHWTETRPDGAENRIQLRVERNLAAELELVANALNQSPLKLGGLVIEFAMDEYRPALETLKTPIGKTLRKWVQGPEDAVKYDEDESTNPTADETAAGHEKI